MPSFSRRVYWLAGLLLGIYGHGSGDLTRSAPGDGGGDLVSCLGCKREPESEEPYDGCFFTRREPGGMASRGVGHEEGAGGSGGRREALYTDTREEKGMEVEVTTLPAKS